MHKIELTLIDGHREVRECVNKVHHLSLGHTFVHINIDKVPKLLFLLYRRAMQAA